MWGVSPAQDVQDALDVLHLSKSTNASASDPINILLIKPGDVRHVIKTISQRKRHLNSTKPLHVSRTV